MHLTPFVTDSITRELFILNYFWKLSACVLEVGKTLAKTKADTRTRTAKRTGIYTHLQTHTESCPHNYAKNAHHLSIVSNPVRETKKRLWSYYGSLALFFSFLALYRFFLAFFLFLYLLFPVKSFDKNKG